MYQRRNILLKNTGSNIIVTRDGVPKYSINNQNDIIITQSFNLNNAFDNVDEIESYALYCAFADCTGLSGNIIFPDLTKVNANGLNCAFKNCTNITSVSFLELTDIDNYGLSNAFLNCSNIISATFSKLTNLISEYSLGSTFKNCTRLPTVSFPELTTVNGSYCFNETFQGCTSLTSIDFPKLAYVGTIENSFDLFYYAFERCTSLTSISFPELVEVGDHAFHATFISCTNLRSASFPKLTTIGNYGLDGIFNGCTALTDSISFPKLKNIANTGLNGAFYNCTNLREIHFRAEIEDTVKTLEDYSDKFGASNATIYCDLGLSYVNITPNISDCTFYIRGKTSTNPLNMYTETENVYYAYKDGYCLYKGTKTPSASDENQTLTENITMTSTGKIVTLNITFPINNDISTTNMIIEYIIDGITFKTDTKNGISTNSTQTSSSPKVSDGTQITYKIKTKGYNGITNTVTPSNNTINITLAASSAEVLEFAYPFTSNSSYLSNLVDNNNFVILDDNSTPASCIASGPKSYNVDDGFSTGYIEFTTPDTDDEDFLTVSVTCTNYAESSYDYGVVFINTTGAIPSSNVSLTTSAGSTDSTYGEILFQGYDNQSSTFRTVTKILNPSTTYYLCFYYRKDSSANSGWDRFAIQNIKIPVEN
jgi:hypothetical protein